MTQTSSWPTKRLRFLTRRALSIERKRLLSQVSQVTFLPMEAIGEQGRLDLSRVRDLEEVRTGYTLFFDGDVVIAKITPCFENGKGAMIAGMIQGVGFGTTELYVLTPSHELDGRFLYYVTVSGTFRNMGEGNMTGAAGQKRVPEEFVRDYPTPLPPLPKQVGVARYLDCETARLDDLVGAKERMLELISEKRQTLISHAILRGIDPRTPVRDSGIPWLGSIPAHWSAERSRWLFKERDTRSEDGSEELLTVSHLTGVTLRSEKDVNMFEAETTEGYKICLKNDLVINTMWAWMGAMGVSPVNGLVSPAYNVYEPNGRMEPSYVDLLVRMPAFAQEVTRFSKGVWSSRLRLYPEGFFEVFLPVPPIHEQKEITRVIAKETAKLDALRTATQRTISLIKERRAALIAAAVSGELEVA